MSQLQIDKSKIKELEPHDSITYIITVTPSQHSPEIERVIKNSLKQAFNLGVLNSYCFDRLIQLALDVEEIEKRRAMKQ